MTALHSAGPHVNSIGVTAASHPLMIAVTRSTVESLKSVAPLIISAAVTHVEPTQQIGEPIDVVFTVRQSASAATDCVLILVQQYSSR